MIVWPVLARELRLRARASATYWLRLAVVLIGAAACLPQFAWSAATLTPSALGRSIFDGTIIAAFLVACCGFILTIDAVSRERHDQTLELLLLTRVKIWDVLAGKLGASGFAGLFGIVAFLPVLMIPVLAGGLTLAEILRKGLVLLNTLFFSLAVGLWASAARRRWLRVIGMVFVVFILPCFLMIRWPLR